MATKQEPIHFKPWQEVLMKEVDCVREALLQLGERLAGDGLTNEQRMTLKHDRARLEADFRQLLVESQRPVVPTPRATRRGRVKLVVPLDDNKQLMLRRD